jgi:hypothetical protein
MARPKGEGKTEGSGRKKGVPNKATANAKQAIADFVDGNSDRLVVWLDQIAESNPKEAFQCFMSVVEYHIPKLSRVDGSTTVNGAISANVTGAIEIVHVKPSGGDTSQDS